MALVGAAGEGPREETPDLNPPSPQGTLQERQDGRWWRITRLGRGPMIYLDNQLVKQI